MNDRHLSIELLRAVHRGERSPADLASIAMAHLFQTCSQCRETFDAWRQELSGTGGSDPLARYDRAFARVRAKLLGGDPDLGDEALSFEAQVASEAQSAEESFSEIASHPPADRNGLILSNPKRFKGPVLADLLLAEARASLPASPESSYAWAHLARTVLQQSTATAYGVELYSRALAFQANGLRAQGELKAAASLMEIGRYLLRADGGGDPLTRAELDSFEGSLRRSQSRFEDARDCFSRAVMSFAIERRPIEAAKNLLALGEVWRELGEVDRAVDAATQALETAREEGVIELERQARHNLSYFLHSLGAHEEARRTFEDNERLYERAALPHRLRRVWLGSHLAKAEGDIEEAEAGYRMAQEGFLRMGRGYEAASVALDVAILYAEEGRISDLKRVAEEIIPIFKSQDVHREAAAALMLFQDAVRAEQVTLRYVIELSRYLERARFDPTLAFQKPA